jgi:MFS family permease
VVLIAGFIWNESKVQHPLVPLSIFKIRNVSGANAVSIPMMASMMGMFYLLSLYIQAVMQYSPVHAGLAFLPFPIILAIVSNTTPRLIPKYGFKPFLVIGTSLIIIGMLWLSQITIESSYALGILPAVIVMAAGMGMSFVAVSIAATSGVPGHEAGLASGLLNTSQQMGGALGLAILVGVSTSVIESSSHLGPIDALVAGDRAAFGVASIFAIIALICAITIIRAPKHDKSDTVEPVTTPH